MKEYIGEDLFGYWYNKKYPPNVEKYGSKYNGYSTDARDVLFQYFAVYGYDLQFKYKGKYYYCVTGKGHVASCDNQFTIEYQQFEDANQYIEQFEINGRKLIDIIDELEEVEPV